MHRRLSPNHTSELLSYSNSTIECLERSDVEDDSTTLISGSTFSNGKLAWLVRGSSLEVVNTKTGQRKAAWRFGWSSTQKRAVTITSVVPFPMEKADRVLVGLKDLSGGLPGMVCLFDPYVSRVIKAIIIPYPVTSLETVLTCGGANAPISLLSMHLKLYFGIVAVGTEQGHTYLLDMGLDDDKEKYDEWNPSSVEFIDCDIEDISSYREQTRESDAHLAVELGGEFYKSGKFYYQKCDSSDQKVYSAGDVLVTAMKYIHQASCLVIGYNFGCFLIWDLSSMSLVYSSQVDQYDMSAITHFAYQEPENDPRNCNYLWVARGPLTADHDPLEVPTTLTLYQLIFNTKQMLPGYGIVYKDLSGCGRRFEHQLTADAHHLADATSVGSRVICCYTLVKESVSHDVSKIDEDSLTLPSGMSRDLTLTVCVWEAPSHDPSSSPTCHLGIFDINRWYHSQMQPSIRDAMFGSKDPTCPFFAFFSMAEILDVANPDGVVGVNIDSTTISRFKTNTEQALEPYFWPASLKFDACCLMETGIVHSKFLGMQRQILASLREGGISRLCEAHSYLNMFYEAGLLPRNLDMSKSQDKNFHLEAILSVCLEHGLIEFITSCIDKLGSQAGPVGFNLRLILDWSWSKVVQFKEQLDQLCVPLFDGGGGTPDDQMLLLLDDMAVQLGHLKSIFQALLNQSETSSQQGFKDLTDKYNVVSILSLYLKILLWLIRHGILPEQCVDEDIPNGQREFVYSNSSFKKYYDMRKAEMSALQNGSLSIGLMIDKITSVFDGLWLSTVGKEEYPPSSLHALSSLILLDRVPSETKLCVIFYLLMDMCSISSDPDSIIIAERFAQAFGMPHNLTKMMKGIWFLDHKDFENAISLLVDPSLETAEFGAWQNSYIIKTLLVQGEFQKALHFVNTIHPTMHTAQDVHLHLSVLLANGLVTEAFNFQRCHRNPSINQDLLMHFFAGCQQNRNISKVMQLPLNDVEEDNFVDFLKQGSFEASKELLVMYYLQRGRYVEGIRLNEAIKHDTMNEKNPVVLERTKIRNAIVDGYVKCLPSIQRKLIFMPEKDRSHYPTAFTEVPRPKPLSTVIHQVIGRRPVSHATILNSVMDKVTEARPQHTPQKRRSGAFVGTPLTPGAKNLLNDSHRMVFAAVEKPEIVPEESTNTFEPLPATPTLLDRKKKKQLYSGADALTLLTTPKIVKRMSRHSIPIDSITVSTTPQSILKVSRVVRRSASPRTSPTTSPPLIRWSQVDKTKQDAKAEDKDMVDFSVEPETPSRRIRFAAEDVSPSPTSTKPTDPTFDEDIVDVPMDTKSHSPTSSPRGVSFQDTAESPHSIILEDERAEEEGEAEVQITAAVVDLRGSSDLEDDVIAQDEEDYSSYELDESDNIIAEDSEEEVMIRKGSETSHPSFIDEIQASTADMSRDSQSDANAWSSGNETEGPLMRSSPRTPVSTSSEDQPSTTWKFSSPSKDSPKYTASPKTLLQPSILLSRRDADLTMTPPKSPETSPVLLAALSKEDKELEEQDSYMFSPPTILRTPITMEPSTSGANRPSTEISTPSTNFLFSPPLTRSMLKRRSLEVSSAGTMTGKTDTTEVSITGRSLRPRSQTGLYSPHQSPTNSPISFISPAPSGSSSPLSSKRRSARKPTLKHKMTLRSRSMTTRSAKLP